MRFMLPAILIASTAATSPTGDTSTPQAMMDSFYSAFRNHGVPDIWVSGDAFMYLSPSFAALERRVQKQADAGQDADAMDHDVTDVCGCQDTEHPIWSTHIDAASGSTAHATGIFKDGKTKVITKFSLLRTPKGWRIDDYGIIGGDNSYRKNLQSDISNNAKHKPGSYQ